MLVRPQNSIINVRTYLTNCMKQLFTILRPPAKVPCIFHVHHFSKPQTPSQFCLANSGYTARRWVVQTVAWLKMIHVTQTEYILAVRQLATAQVPACTQVQYNLLELHNTASPCRSGTVSNTEHEQHAGAGRLIRTALLRVKHGFMSPD